MPQNAAELIAAAEDAGHAGNPPPGIGAALREARERLGLSVADVSGNIKFASRQIEALEADDFAHLPEATFLRGFIRSYAKLLHLDPAALLASLPQAPKPEVADEASALHEVPFPGAYSERRPNIIWLVAALAVAVALALSVWMMSSPAKNPVAQKPAGVAEAAGGTVTQAVVLPEPMAVSAVAGASSSVAPAVPAPVRSNAAAGMIHLVFDRDSWVEVTDRDGKILLSKLNPHGTEQNINGAPPFSLVIGEAKSVHLYYRGKPVDLTPYIRIEVARLTLE